MQLIGPLVLAAMLVGVTAEAANAETVRLKCIADTNVSSYPSEQNFNYGATPRIRLKGIEMLGLFQFDSIPIEGWKVTKATLFLRYAGADRKLRTIGISTIASPWNEGTGNAEAKQGEATFLTSGKGRWNGPDTDITDVTFGASYTRSAYADITILNDGWFSVPVRPDLVQAMIAHDTYGLAVTDEKGQTRANNDVYSKEQNGSAPYLVVEGTPYKTEHELTLKASAEPSPKDSTMSNGAIRISITPSEGVFCYKLNASRLPIGNDAATQDIDTISPPQFPCPQSGKQLSYLFVTPPKADFYRLTIIPIGPTGLEGKPAIVLYNNSVKIPCAPPLATPISLSRPTPKQIKRSSAALTAKGLYAFSCADTDKVNPVNGAFLKSANDRYGQQVNIGVDRSNAAYGNDSTTLFGARGEILGFQIIIGSADSGAKLSGLSATIDRQFIGHDNSIEPQISMSRLWYVRAKEWYPEACIPITAQTLLTVPALDNAIPGQSNQSIFVDLILPKTARPGEYHSVIRIKQNGTEALAIPLNLIVNQLVLPDKLSFDISLNAYGSLGGIFNMSDDTPEYRAIELSFQRLAHAHRTTLAQLGYSHSGNITSNYAPPVTGAGKAMHVTDWTAWDAQFGPYLDGSAFAGLPRSSVPITHLYLPFHEAWPVDIRSHYEYQQTVTTYPEMITEHALVAKPIDEAVDAELKDGFTAIAAEYARHFATKGWTKTAFQFYQNDKNYYKDPKMGGKGTSWWLLDEPNHRDDWKALAMFSRLFKQGTGEHPAAHFVMREDISRPQWQRDYLNGLVDLMCVSGELYTKQPLMKQLKSDLGVTYWNYGTANSVDKPNTDSEAWALRAWLSGADAIVPWDSIGSDKNFIEPEDTALLLPGTRFGVAGPIASMRVKALRRAQQDVEYIVLLAQAHGWTREQTGVAVRNLLPLRARYQKQSDADAGAYSFADLSAEDMDMFRRIVSENTGK